MSAESKVCPSCQAKGSVHCCKRCNEEFCAEYASKIDQQFCLHCMSDVTLIDTTITKEVITKSLSGKKIFRRVMKARHLVFEGQDWMFAQARVTTLSVSELERTIEYHREILNAMLNEREVRRIKQNQANLKKLVSHTTKRAEAPEEHADADIVTTTTTTRVRKTTIRAAKTGDPIAAVASILASFKAKGLSDEQIRNALMAVGTSK